MGSIRTDPPPRWSDQVRFRSPYAPRLRPVLTGRRVPTGWRRLSLSLILAVIVSVFCRSMFCLNGKNQLPRLSRYSDMFRLLLTARRQKTDVPPRPPPAPPLAAPSSGSHLAPPE
eukprot:3804170-Rhodomonas_salina.1